MTSASKIIDSVSCGNQQSGKRTRNKEGVYTRYCGSKLSESSKSAFRHKPYTTDSCKVRS